MSTLRVSDSWTGVFGAVNVVTLRHQSSLTICPHDRARNKILAAGLATLPELRLYEAQEGEDALFDFFSEKEKVKPR